MTIESLPGELWLPVYGHSERHRISNKGRLKRLAYKVKRKDGVVTSRAERLVTGAIDKTTGYRVVVLSANGKNKTTRMHRLAAQAFIPNPESHPEVNHIDFNKSNNCDDNLEWVNSKQNTIHSRDAGYFNGLTNPKCRIKLSPENVADMRDRHAGGESYASLGRAFGITTSTARGETTDEGEDIDSLVDHMIEHTGEPST